MHIEGDWAPRRAPEPTLFVGLLSVDKRTLISPVLEDANEDDPHYLFHEPFKKSEHVSPEGLARIVMNRRGFLAINSERALSSPEGSEDRGYLLRLSRDDEYPSTILRPKSDIEEFVKTSKDVQAHFLRIALEDMR